MAIIEEYLANQSAEVSRLPRAPQTIVDVGQGIVAEAIGAAAGQAGQAAIDIANVEAQKQASRDAVTLAEIKGALDEFEFNSAPDISKIQTIQDFKKQEEQYYKDWERKAKTLTHGRSRTVQDRFKIYTEQHRTSAKISYTNKRRPLEKDWAMASFQKEWANRLKSNAGNPISAKKHLELLVDQYDPYLTRKEKQSFLASIDESIAEFNKIKYLEAVAVTTRRLPYVDAINYINEIPRTQITEPERNSLKTQRTAQKNIQDVELEVQREKDRDEISDLIRSSQSATKRIENSLLDETEQFTWSERERLAVERRVKRIPIITDQRVKGSLESMAYDISTGAVTMPELKKRLDDERYSKETIDDSVYDEIFSLAEREFKSYQAGAMKDREIHALGQIVTHPSELGFEEKLRQLTSQLSKDQERALRQLQFNNLDQYKKALRDWLKENKDAGSDVIYTEGRKLLKHYRKSPDQLRKDAETINLLPATDKKILEAARQVESDIQKGLSGVNTMINPGTLAVFEERMAQLPTRDARQRYYNKWYKDVKDK